MRSYRFLEKITIKKGPLFPISKRSTSIHKNNPAYSMGYIWVSIVLQKHYFHGIYAFSKKKGNFTRSCAFAQKVKFYALQMLKKQNLTHPKAAKLATLGGGGGG